jgi:hypothetical protein
VYLISRYLELSLQHYVIKFVRDLRQVGGFLRYFTNKTDRHDITELLLKVALKTIPLICYFRVWKFDGCYIICCCGWLFFQSFLCNYQFSIVTYITHELNNKNESCTFCLLLKQIYGSAPINLHVF